MSECVCACVRECVSGGADISGFFGGALSDILIAAWCNSWSNRFVFPLYQEKELKVPQPPAE